MELEGERFRAQESISKCLHVENEWPTGLGRHGGPFIAPQGNLPIGVSESRTCSDWGGGHVWQPSLESGLDIGHVWCLALIQG
jgi:hypothetical protein